jgi:hypothetical protein
MKNKINQFERFLLEYKNGLSKEEVCYREKQLNETADNFLMATETARNILEAFSTTFKGEDE